MTEFSSNFYEFCANVIIASTVAFMVGYVIGRISQRRR